MNYRVATSPTSRRGFTLVELLIVIGIIAVLISILLPAVSKVRVAAQKVATQNTINRLEQACNQYFSDYNAYPGPFFDGQLGPASTTPPYLLPGAATPYQLEMPNPVSPGTYISFAHAPTSSENLFLGLCGGLRATTVGGTTHFYYDSEIAKAGRGPSWISLNAAKKSQSYMELSNGDIAVDEDMRNPVLMAMAPAPPVSFWWPPSAQGGPAYGTNFVGDSAIFEFMDRFSRPKPILYLRAVRGVARTGNANTNRTGFIFDPANPGTDVTSPFQYDPTKIQWTYSNSGYDKLNMALRDGQTWTASTTDYPKVLDDTGTKTKFDEGNERYFVNEQVSTGNPTLMTDGTKNLVPIHKDGFILISAGADGIYGTADDIRN